MRKIVIEVCHHADKACFGVIERFFIKKGYIMDCSFEFDNELRKWKFMLVLPLDGVHPDYREVKERLAEVIGDMDNDEPYFKYTNLEKLAKREK